MHRALAVLALIALALGAVTAAPFVPALLAMAAEGVALWRQDAAS